MDRLDTMYAMQRELQEKFNGGRVLEDYNEEEHVAELMPNAFAMFAELFEAFKEVGWKSWASSRHINRPAYKAEMVDAFHFFMNMMLHAGMTPQELFDGYLEKNIENNRRADEGYDGVSTKCPVCKAEYTDKGVECSPGVHVIPNRSQTELAIHVEPVRVPRRNVHARQAVRTNDVGTDG
jgi:dimeric dUTPase (all-alpha-NTP-PPase superfamily)